MPTGSRKKIALVFTGAVSLGSFEAGVAYEIVKSVREQERPDMEVDVIVGTSAGALTGAMMALALVFGTAPEVIEDSWLSVQLEDLLRLNPGDRSLLSSSKVEELIAKYVRPPLPEEIKYHGYEGSVNLVVVVTNLDGVKYRIHRTRDSEFSISATGYEDALKFRVSREFSDWDRLRTAVRASSAYPVAFEHKTILRGNREYQRVARYNFTGEEKAFRYSDGGIVNNQPLNKAIEMVSELPEGSGGGEYERVILVVDPTPPGGDLAQPEDYGVFDVASKAVWTIPRNQTLYKDLLLVEKVNRRLRWKNTFISAMADVWNQHPVSAEKGRPLQDLCHEVAMFKGSKILEMDPKWYLETERGRISSAYSRELKKVQNKDFFLDYCFLLEQVADLRNKREITVEMIRPMNADQELAGVIFGNFGGFLDTGFMKHDFNVGRTYARRWLKKEIEMSRLVRFEQKSVPPHVRRKVFQKMFENSVPLLVEEIGPRLFSGRVDISRDVTGVLTVLRMLVAGLGKYIAAKSVTWVREKFTGRAPKKKEPSSYD